MSDLSPLSFFALFILPADFRLAGNFLPQFFSRITENPPHDRFLCGAGVDRSRSGDAGGTEDHCTKRLRFSAFRHGHRCLVLFLHYCCTNLVHKPRAGSRADLFATCDQCFSSVPVSFVAPMCDSRFAVVVTDNKGDQITIARQSVASSAGEEGQVHAASDEEWPGILGNTMTSFIALDHHDAEVFVRVELGDNAGLKVIAYRFCFQVAPIVDCCCLLRFRQANLTAAL